MAAAAVSRSGLGSACRVREAARCPEPVGISRRAGEPLGRSEGRFRHGGPAGTTRTGPAAIAVATGRHVFEERAYARGTAMAGGEPFSRGQALEFPRHLEC